jgi:hypothetical protein
MAEAQRSKGKWKATLVALTALVALASALVAFGRQLLGEPGQEPAQTPAITVHNTVVATAVGGLNPSTAKEPEPSPRQPAAASPPQPTAVPGAAAADGQLPVCLGLAPQLKLEKASVRYVEEWRGRHSYLVTLVVSSAGDSPVSVSHVGDPSLTDDSGKMLRDGREGFPSGAQIPLSKAEYLFKLGLKVEPKQPQALTYRFERASHRGQTASLSSYVVLAEKLSDGNFTALGRPVSCESLKVE